VDATAQTTFVMFDEMAEKVIGVPINQLLSIIEVFSQKKNNKQK
jgi:hypothetical protein